MFYSLIKRNKEKFKCLKWFELVRIYKQNFEQWFAFSLRENLYGQMNMALNLS